MTDSVQKGLKTITCEKCGKVMVCSQGSYKTHLRWCDSEYAKAEFWKRVNKDGANGCWLYTGFKKWDGYGWLCRGHRWLTAHRYAWILTHGEPPEGMHILHMCDVPACCNPAHLRLGTHQDNMADARAKGRHVYGERTRKNKLTFEKVESIRREHWRKGRRSNTSALAAKYGVGTGAINAIIAGRAWKERRPAIPLHPGRVKPVRRSA